MPRSVFWFFMFAMVKAIVPRYRYDQLMRLGWKVFLPTSLVAVALVAAWRVFGPAASRRASDVIRNPHRPGRQGRGPDGLRRRLLPGA